MDYGHRKTDEELKILEVRIKRVYRQARKEIQGKVEKALAEFAKEDARQYTRVLKGELDVEDYRKWRSGAARKNRWFRDMRDTLAADLVTADRKAMSMVNGSLPDAYALNYNYGTYEIEHGTSIDTSFTLYDRDTVERLIRDDPDLLPEPQVDIPKDMRWNKQHLNSAITQGILQGESIPDIAKRLAGVALMDENAAIRNARTMTTSAENAGRVNSYKRAAGMGIKMRQMWLATIDGRTRHEHRLLDGQSVEVGKPFKVDGNEIMFPGDPAAPGYLIYNCRCTLIANLEGFEHDVTDSRFRPALGGMDYEEWKKEKRVNNKGVKKKTAAKPIESIVNGKDISATWQRRADRFNFEIEDVINAQGFDGMPRVVSAEEFDAAVRQSNFIAQRTYSAPDQETLDTYRDMLYNGKWYVDCSTGGAQYGQGMYCAADYNGQLTDGIKAEMQHYRDQYMAQFGYDLTPEQWLENSSAVLQKYRLDSSQYGEIARAYLDEDDKLFERLTHQLSASERDKLYDELYEVPHRGIHNYVETFTLDPSAKIVSWREINDIRTGTLGIEYRNKVLEEELKRRGLSGDELTFARFNAGLGVSWNEVDAAARRLGAENRNAVMEQLEDAGNAAQRRFNEEQERRRESARIYQEKYHDIGSLAATLGYDAINADGHGQSGSYTVILNRTKLIIRDGRK